MAEINHSWERLSCEESKISKEDLIIYFEKEMGEKIGIISAEQILNHFLKSTGSKIYNKGVYDAKKALETRFKNFSLI